MRAWLLGGVALLAIGSARAAPNGWSVSPTAASIGAAQKVGGNTFSKTMTSTATDCDQCIVDLGIVGGNPDGPAAAQNGLKIDSEKLGWYNGTAKQGEIDPLQIYGRQGGGTGTSGGAASNADMSGILVNVQSRDDNVGFTNVLEGAASIFTYHTATTGDTITHAIDVQLAAIYAPTSTYDGYVANSNVGVNTDAYVAQSGAVTSPVGTWTNFFRGSNNNATQFLITGAGDISIMRSITAMTGGITQTGGTSSVNSLGPTTATTLTSTGTGTFNNLSVYGGTVSVGSDPNGGLIIGQQGTNSGSSALTGHLDFVYNPAGSSGASQSARLLVAASGVLQTITGGALNHYDTASGTTYVVPVTVPSLTVSGAGRIAGGTVSGQTGAYTLTPADCGTTIRDTGTAAHNYTVPTGLPIGCRVSILQAGAGAVTAAAGSGETAEYSSGASSGATTANQFASVKIFVDTASTFVVGAVVP